MPLDFQLVSVQFTQGMDTRTSKKLVIPGKWNLLQNCNLSTNDALTKRDGVTNLIAAQKGNGLATFERELLTINGTSVASVSATVTPATAIQTTGQLGFVEVTKEQIQRATGYQEAPDCATGLGFTAYVWRDFTAAGAFNGNQLLIKDEASGSTVLQQAVSGTSQPRVVFSLDAFFVFYMSAAAPDTLSCFTVRVSAGNLVAGAVVALIADANLATTYPFDACEFATSAAVAGVGLSYIWADGATSVRAIQVTHAAGVPSIQVGPVNLITEVQAPNATIFGIGVCWMNSAYTNFATFAYGTAGTIPGVATRILDNLFAVTAAAFQVDATTPAVATNCHVVAAGQTGVNTAIVFTDQVSSIGSAAAVQPIRRTEIALNAGVITIVSAATSIINSVVGIGGAATTLAPPQGPFICGKPIVNGLYDSAGTGALVTGAVFLPVCVFEYYGATSVNTLNQQNTIFLLDGKSAVVVAKALYGTWGIPSQIAIAPLQFTPSSVISVSNPAALTSLLDYNAFGLVTSERGHLSFTDGLNTTQSGLVRLTFVPRNVGSPIKAQMGQATYFTGGSLTMYDGKQLGEVGFPLFPEGIAAVVSAGGAMTVGTHQVVAVYEWVDGQGQRHQSAPSLPVSFTISGGQQTCTVSVPSLMLSQKVGLSIVLFMTQAGGTIFNRVTALSLPVLNNTAAVSVSQAVVIADTSFIGNELLYTQPLQSGTTLASDAPGPTSALGVHQNRLFVDLTDRPGVFRYSQALIPGVGLQFNESLQGTTPVDGGRIVGFADLDEKVIIFCARKIYAVVGSGPTPSGAYSNYSEPIEIPSDTGCLTARSILKTPGGIIFKSKKGFHLLTRDLTVKYIGEATYAYDPFEVLSAVYVEDRKEARFSCAFSFHLGQGSAEIGVTLVYSYLVDQWSISIFRVLPDGLAARTFVAYDAIWWPRLGVYVSTSLVDGLIRDTPGIYLDDLVTGVTAVITMTARTSFLHLPEFEGFQRVRWLYLTTSLPTATAVPTGVRVTVDYDDVYSAVTTGSPGYYTADWAASVAAPNSGVLDFRHKLHRQKCKSVAFTFSNLDSFASMSSITGFEALALEIGVKRGTNKLPATMTVP
jgi:hypothetical protein